MILEVKKITISDTNLILQFIIFAFILIGIYYVKGKSKNLKRHRLSMGLAVILNAFSIFIIMGRSLLTLSSFLVEKFYMFGSFLTWLHAVIGSLAEILGVTLLFKHPRKIVHWMRITATLWIVALLLGIFFYVYYYIL